MKIIVAAVVLLMLSGCGGNSSEVRDCKSKCSSLDGQTYNYVKAGRCYCSPEE